LGCEGKPRLDVFFNEEELKYIHVYDECDDDVEVFYFVQMIFRGEKKSLSPPQSREKNILS